MIISAIALNIEGAPTAQCAATELAIRPKSEHLSELVRPNVLAKMFCEVTLRNGSAKLFFEKGHAELVCNQLLRIGFAKLTYQTCFANMALPAAVFKYFMMK